MSTEGQWSEHAGLAVYFVDNQFRYAMRRSKRTKQWNGFTAREVDTAREHKIVMGDLFVTGRHREVKRVIEITAKLGSH